MNKIIRVPGSFRRNVAYVDLETEKVNAPENFRMPNGEVLRRRWAVVMAGAAHNGRVFLFEGYEKRILMNLCFIALAPEIVYGSTGVRFDEGILRGRFTNARRAWLPEPTFPAMPGAEKVSWRNIGSTAVADRSKDVPSKDVPKVLREDGGRIRVKVHLLRDVVELILADGAPDAKCERWCRKVLRDYRFAEKLVS